MLAYYGKYTESAQNTIVVSGGTEATLISISAKVRVKWFMVKPNVDNLEFKIYIDGVLVNLLPAYGDFSFTVSVLYNHYGGVNRGLRLLLRECDYNSGNYVVECDIEFIAIQSFEIKVYNPNPSSYGVSGVVIYEAIP